MRSALAKQSGSTGGVIVMFRVSLVTALLTGCAALTLSLKLDLRDTKDFKLRQVIEQHIPADGEHDALLSSSIRRTEAGGGSGHAARAGGAGGSRCAGPRHGPIFLRARGRGKFEVYFNDKHLAGEIISW